MKHIRTSHLKRWVYEQYDSMVGTVNMSTNAPKRCWCWLTLKEADKALAMTVDCNAVDMFNADPEEGCAIAVAEAARNITVFWRSSFSNYELLELW